MPNEWPPFTVILDPHCSVDFEGNQIIEHKASQKAGPMRRRGHYYSNTISLQNHRSLMILTTKFSNKKPFRIISPTFMAATAMMLEKWQIHAILWANYDLVNLAATQSKRNGVCRSKVSAQLNSCIAQPLTIKDTVVVLRFTKYTILHSTYILYACILYMYMLLYIFKRRYVSFPHYM